MGREEMGGEVLLSMEGQGNEAKQGEGEKECLRSLGTEVPRCCSCGMVQKEGWGRGMIMPSHPL